MSLFHSLIVLSFSNAPEAMMFCVGWQAVHSTTSETSDQLINIKYISVYINNLMMILETSVHIKSVSKIPPSKSELKNHVSYLNGLLTSEQFLWFANSKYR